ncbi:hypothetical protein C451_17230 [Halococcus thailandensis JCM 13552]|uniref:Uncharacterized protein n=1 Tax=Halococcus thailandensis JCM 13552 TaxID=1227457 RepID=M0MY64_9EURY|nr:hypothetical protein C451_17230 [Halococcus thailandensis JCM 13552]
MEHHCEHDNERKRNEYDVNCNRDYDGVQCDHKFHHDFGTDDHRSKRDGHVYRDERENDRYHDIHSVANRDYGVIHVCTRNDNRRDDGRNHNCRDNNDERDDDLNHRA